VSRRAAARVLPAAVALALLFGLLVAGPQPRAAAAEQRPSFVVIQTDDQTLDELYASHRAYPGAPATRAMPATLDLIAKRGVTFSRYYTPYALCAPSRVSLLTGRYPHNHNDRGNVPPNDGFGGFASRGAAAHNLATWLQGSGYRTIHVGKFLNGYGDPPYSDGTEVPAGWSSWWAVPKADTDHYFYGYTLNHDGVIEGPFGESGDWGTREYGARDDAGCPFAPLDGLPCNYQTDKLSQIATEELATTPSEQPFYLQLDYTAPHGDFRRPAGPEPAPRHYDWFRGTPYPHGGREGFNEANVNDKPRFIRSAPYLTASEAHTYRVYYQKCLESLRSVDDGVRELIAELGALHRLRNTYVIFTSDNGFFYGEHRMVGGKFLAYEPAAHLPLLIRGPGIKPGSENAELVSTVDIAPTILELAGVEADKSVDGRSLFPYAHDPGLRSSRPLLFESFVQSSDVEAGGLANTLGRPRPAAAHASIVAPPKDYEGIVLGAYKYIEWPDGEKELYDLDSDPDELDNIVRDPNFFPIRAFLHAQLIRLEDCVGRACGEPAPDLPLTRDQQRKVDKERREEERRKQREREEKQHHKRTA
jgi:N-acetylglucosamine-6-sulfatase